MNFGFPQFLWALTALSIPLLIHLFNFRKAKTVFFSNTRFLKRLEQESKAIKKLRYWLIFAMRALALSFLVFAFSQPYVLDESTSLEESEVVHHLYIDNSYSMKRSGEEGPLFVQAKIIAADILQNLPESAKVKVYSNLGGFSSQGFNSPKLSLDWLDRLDYNSRFLSLTTLLQGCRNNYQEDAVNKVYLISDFQNSLFEASLPASNESEEINLIPLKSLEGANNIAIDSIGFDKPIFVEGMEQSLSIWLSYESSEKNTFSLELKFNDSLYSAQLLEIEGGKEQKIEIPFTVPKGSYHKGEIRIDKGKPNFDNQFYFAFQNQQAPLVYALGEPLPEKIKALFANKYFDFQESGLRDVNYSKLETASLIILHTDQSIENLKVNLQNHLSKGANLWVLARNSAPALQENLSYFGIQVSDKWQTDSLRAQSINYKDPFYQDVFIEEFENPDLPFSRSHVLNLSQESINLVGLSNRNAMLARKSYAKGQVFYALSQIDGASSNILGHESFMPLLVNAALFKDQALSYYLEMGALASHQDIMASGSADQPMSILWKKETLIPAQSYKEGLYKIKNEGLELKPGLYPLSLNEKEVANLALNMDRKESDLKAADRSQLIEYFGDSVEIIDPQENSSLTKLKAGLALKDKSLGSSFIFAVLIFLALEMILLWKRTT